MTNIIQQASDRGRAAEEKLFDSNFSGPAAKGEAAADLNATRLLEASMRQEVATSAVREPAAGPTTWTSGSRGSTSAEEMVAGRARGLTYAIPGVPAGPPLLNPRNALIREHAARVLPY